MELVVLVVLFVVGRAALGAVREAVGQARDSAERDRLQRVRERQQLQRRQQHAARQRVLRDRQSRHFQAALLTLGRTPDFRRAATYVRSATLVPRAFVLRQYARFRPVIVEHYRRRLAAGANAVELHQSLRQLMAAFRLADFEADYVRTEAERSVQAAVTPVTPADRVAILRQAHEDRVQAIRTGVTDAELQEPLLEAETTRFREELAALFDPPATATAGPLG